MKTLHLLTPGAAIRIAAIALIVACTGMTVNAQKYFTKNGTVAFVSEAPVEKIEAVNSKGTCVWDTESGALEMAVLVKGFRFEKALMEEHFNENYMESTKFPKAIFKGRIENMEDIDLKSDGQYTGVLMGDLTIHGVTQSVSTNATFSVLGDELTGEASFDVEVADYDIEIPKLVADNIAKVVSISVTADFQPLNK